MKVKTSIPCVFSHHPRGLFFSKTMSVKFYNFLTHLRYQHSNVKRNVQGVINHEKDNILSVEKSKQKLTSNPNDENQHSKTCDEENQNVVEEDEIRLNEINVQMLPKKLFNQLFGQCDENKSKEKVVDVNFMKKNLKKYAIDTDSATRLPNIDLPLPPLEGNNLEEHFRNIAQVQLEPYLKIINRLINDIPEKPKEWALQEGWTRYTKDGIQSVDFPLEDGIVFDVEVCVKHSPLPVLATAVSEKAWYSWVSKSLCEASTMSFCDQSFTTNMLIPFESKSNEYGKRMNEFQKKPKIIVGHNVSYDRSKIKEQYWLNCTGTRFLDTMSLHICVSGVTSFQRSLLKSKKDTSESQYLSINAALNNLKDVYKLYCNKEISKDLKNIFLEGNLMDVKNNFNDLINYCASDVMATQNVLQELFPLFQERFPHPVTLSGMLELGTAYLPVNSNWERYLEEAEATYEDMNYESKFILSKRADEVCKLMHNEKYKEDLWMWDQDWSTQKIKFKSSLSKSHIQQISIADDTNFISDEEIEKDELEQEFSYLKDTKHFLPVKFPHMPGYPAWYRKLCPKISEDNWAPGPQNISISMQIVPKLLNLTWENYPLHYIREYGWGFLVPYNNDPNIQTKLPLKELLKQCPLPSSQNFQDSMDYAMSTLDKDVQNNLHRTKSWQNKKNKVESLPHKVFYKGTGIWCNVDIDNCCYFFKLPHKDGSNQNVGNPLAKDFLNKFSENVLASPDPNALEILKIARMLSYWRNNRDRIFSQNVVWLEEQGLTSNMKMSKTHMRYGAIIPQVVVSGTLTRRAVEPTWMTASNAHVERIGSELRSMIQAPPGYNIVGADVDSQELWISSIIGDAYFAKIHGATPFGWMTLMGTKSNGTDMHSITAKAVGISRDHAKVINYARIYGAGQKFAEKLLKQFNPTMTEAEAASKAKKMFDMTKGKKMYKLKANCISEDLPDKLYPSYDAYAIAKMFGKTLSDVVDKYEWVGGSESPMFNRLEEIASDSRPVTPFLNSRLTRALEDRDDNEVFLPTKVNWVVQSGAVDFLHLMLVSMKWLMRDNIRFCLSFHDEVRYLVPSQYKYNAALAMHVTNLLVRSFCASRLGMSDLPMSVAFFTSVEIDTVLRKESSQDCITPSNSQGLKITYGIPTGESLNVWQALDKSNGSLGCWQKKNANK